VETQLWIGAAGIVKLSGRGMLLVSVAAPARVGEPARLPMIVLPRLSGAGRKRASGPLS
jgi:hypothetical protein